MAKILLVDDEEPIRAMVRYALERDQHVVLEAGDGLSALRLAAEHQPDVIVLDIMMPELDGLETCRRLRATSRVPIIFLSSRDEEIDRIIGLEIGGDDYVAKPFSPRELVARIKALLRRSQLVAAAPATAAPGTGQKIVVGRLSLDLARFQVRWDQTELILTVTEFALLRTLAERPGIVLSRDALMNGAYDDYRTVTDRTMDSHIRRLRAKFAALGASPIETIHGLGYKLTDCR